MLDTAAALFYERGVHEVGMDELVRATGLAKASVYRLYPTKDALIEAYLTRAASAILTLIDADTERHAQRPAAALGAIFDAVARDVARTNFRGCAFNNASIEFADPRHPARAAARAYREELLSRLRILTGQICTPRAADRLAAHLALIIDGMYTSAAHLGAGGPAAEGRALAMALIRDAA